MDKGNTVFHGTRGLPRVRWQKRGYKATILCPACNGKIDPKKHMLGLHTGLYFCPKCNCITGETDMETYRDVVCSGRWAQEDPPHDRWGWFDVTVKGHGRYHGVRDSLTGDLIQSG